MAVTAQPASVAAAISQSEASGPAYEPNSDALAEAQAVASHSEHVEADEAGQAAQVKGGMHVLARPCEQPASQVMLC